MYQCGRSNAAYKERQKWRSAEMKGTNYPVISVIVPVYNVGKYIRRCLDSLLVQSYKNVEIVLVDDGSTDDSGEICDEYAAVNPQIVVLHQRNKGVSAARNAGIQMVRGGVHCICRS